MPCGRTSRTHGLESADDAPLAVSRGADGIVSNHGGRATETSRPTIDPLPEVMIVGSLTDLDRVRLALRLPMGASSDG